MSRGPETGRRRSSVIAGVGASVPSAMLTNNDLATWLETDDQWIRSRTGVVERRISAPERATSDLAVEAGAQALESAGTADVDVVVLATTTPDRPCPATAPEVAAALGLGTVPAFDLAAVCSGFLYALSVAAGYIESGRAHTVLVIAADTFSTILDRDDRATMSVFGDGAGAVLLRAGFSNEPGAVGHVDLGSDGSLRDLITVPAGGSRQRGLGVAAAEDDMYFRMEGRTVFMHAVERMTSSAQSVLARGGLTVADIDRFVGHQANIRILRAVALQLGLDVDRVVVNLDQVGNTAAASIPLALRDGHARGEIRAGERVLLSAFGGGATWGSTILIWPELPPQQGEAAVTKSDRGDSNGI
nr:beta-ketoacyl-ACP synthase III [Williamsia sp.]